jgi:hypothetical protein
LLTNPAGSSGVKHPPPVITAIPGFAIVKLIHRIQPNRAHTLN